MKIKFLICIFAFYVLSFGLYSFAQENNQLAVLTKQIIEAKTSESAFKLLGALKNLYFQDNKYNELVEFLKSLSNTKKALEPLANYYIGLARYHQLKNLEEKQNWDEYFVNVNAYRDEITATLAKAINSSGPKEMFSVYAKLLLWQFHHDQQDAFHETALSDLINSALEYAKIAPDPQPIKAVADKLLAYAEKSKSRQLYKVYADKLVNAGLKEADLARTASDFYKEANPELAELIYDIYIAQIIKSYPKEKLIPRLTEIAKMFAYKDTGIKDEIYAESIFKKIEDTAGKEIFDEELMYLRAFNLEKVKEYDEAKDYYVELAQRFPSSIYVEKAQYKAGVIYAYVLGDLKAGRHYFGKLAQEETPALFGILSLYQLGLFSQWEEDYPKAKEYYQKLLQNAGDNFPEAVSITQERIKEIDAAKPIEYNLKTFLDLSFRPEHSSFEMTKVDLKTSLYQAKAGQNINITCAAHIGESGCMQVELEYLWSGNLGQTKPSSQQASFNTQYAQPGTKQINLVVVSAAGIIDRNIDLLDID